MSPMIDWTALGEETVENLRRYLMVDTTNPPGQEAAGAAFLAEILDRERIPATVEESAPGRANLVARLRGDGSLGGLVLHHHIDVVYADPRYWSVPPFGGIIRDGYLYGRGALDMKSIGILQLMAVVALKRARVPLARDLVLLATADEEAGSRYGAQWIAEHRREWLGSAEYALSEFGGILRAPDFRAPLGVIHISEKTALALRLTARAAPGHGSMPWPDTAPHRLIRALNRLLAAERPLRVLPEVAEYFARQATVLSAEEAVGLDDLARSLGDPAFRARFLASAHRAAMVRTTFAVNMLRASEKRNVIPPEASADIDCRMLAGDDPDEIVAWVRDTIADTQIDVEITGPRKQPNLSPPDTELYKALAEAIHRRAPDAVVVPEVLVAFTDNWVFRRCGLHAYGFSPLVLDMDEVARVHGNDERVSLENIRAGVRAYTELLLASAAS
jgi:acetylornithine deacetylase/succinyl-diaminopimelate desuccinylase-like protein